MHLIVDISLLVVKCAFRIIFNWALIEKKGRKAILTDFIDVVIIEITKIYKILVGIFIFLPTNILH